MTRISIHIGNRSKYFEFEQTAKELINDFGANFYNLVSKSHSQWLLGKVCIESEFTVTENKHYFMLNERELFKMVEYLT